MELPLYQIDAFSDKVFAGNPACVVPLEEWLPDETLLLIAQENAVAETAFFLKNQRPFPLRWFTPEIEMDLCGHATLATAHCISSIIGVRQEEILFDTKSGILSVQFYDGLYHMNFPVRIPKPSTLPPAISKALNIAPRKVLKSRDYMLVYDKEIDIRNITIDRSSLDTINIDPGGVIVTAPGDTCDFVSRFFTPQASILEDPVTGSAHCSLIPYWTQRLNKTVLDAQQLSARGGRIICQYQGERVIISGQATTYLSGTIYT